MGVETAVAATSAVIAGGTAVYGATQQKKARKAADRAAKEQRSFQEQQQGQMKKEADRLNSEIAKTQRQINAGQARANRARIKGGIFGESEQTQRNLTPTLG